jgi:hypothetical protein
MELAPAWGRGRQKGYWVKGVRAGKQGYTGAFSESILLFFARAGFLTLYIFFFNINRVLGVNSIITLGFRTHMRIFFLHLIGF